MILSIAFPHLLLSGAATFASGALVAAAASALRGRKAGRARAAHRLAAGVLDSSPDAVLRLDEACTCTVASGAAATLFGLARETIVGRSFWHLTGDDHAAIETALARVRGGEAGVEAVFRTPGPPDTQRWIEARFSPDAQGQVVAALRDVSTRKTAELALRVANFELNKMAGTDILTGLANRRRFDQSLEAECRRASRSEAPVSLLLLDMDRFRGFNEAYGQLAGDACLRQIGATLRTFGHRASELAARFGGQEFALMLPGADERESLDVAERIREAVLNLAVLHEGNADAGGTVSVSIGCATVRVGAESVALAGRALIAGADAALYDAKRGGRNRIAAQSRGIEPEAAAERLAANAARLTRLESLRAAGVFQPSPNLDRIARMAAMLLGVPSSFIALLDRDAVAVVGRHGLGETPLELPHALCATLLGARGPVVVPDGTTDPRFQAFSAAHNFAFLAAVPLLSGDDLQHVGAFWVADRQADRPFDEPKRMLLSRLASLVMEDFESRGGADPLAAETA